MTKLFLILLTIIFFLMGCVSTFLNAQDEIDVVSYLNEAKEFINCDISTSKKSERLIKYLAMVDHNDYLSHILVDSQLLIIHFKKTQGDSFFLIGLKIDLMKDRSCGRITVNRIEQ